MLIFKTIYVILATIISIRILHFIHMCCLLIKQYAKSSRDWSRIESNELALEDIYHLSPHEFVIWCGYLLKMLGCMDIINNKSGFHGSKDIICTIDGEKIYVKCMRYYYRLFTDIVDKDTVEKFAGAMAVDSVKCGIIMTTGRVSKKAREFAKTLGGPISIRIMDGKEIVDAYNGLNSKFGYDDFVEELTPTPE